MGRWNFSLLSRPWNFFRRRKPKPVPPDRSVDPVRLLEDGTEARSGLKLYDPEGIPEIRDALVIRNVPNVERIANVEDDVRDEQNTETVDTPNVENTADVEDLPGAKHTPETVDTLATESVPGVENVANVEDLAGAENTPEIVDNPVIGNNSDIANTPHTEDPAGTQHTPVIVETLDVENAADVEDHAEAEHAPGIVAQNTMDTGHHARAEDAPEIVDTPVIGNTPDIANTSHTEDPAEAHHAPGIVAHNRMDTPIINITLYINTRRYPAVSEYSAGYGSTSDSDEVTDSDISSDCGSYELRQPFSADQEYDEFSFSATFEILRHIYEILQELWRVQENRERRRQQEEQRQQATMLNSVDMSPLDSVLDELEKIGGLPHRRTTTFNSHRDNRSLEPHRRPHNPIFDSRVTHSPLAELSDEDVLDARGNAPRLPIQTTPTAPMDADELPFRPRAPRFDGPMGNFLEDTVALLSGGEDSTTPLPSEYTPIEIAALRLENPELKSGAEQTSIGATQHSPTEVLDLTPPISISSSDEAKNLPTPALFMRNIQVNDISGPVQAGNEKSFLTPPLSRPTDNQSTSLAKEPPRRQEIPESLFQNLGQPWTKVTFDENEDISITTAPDSPFYRLPGIKELLIATSRINRMPCASSPSGGAQNPRTTLLHERTPPTTNQLGSSDISTTPRFRPIPAPRTRFLSPETLRAHNNQRYGIISGNTEISSSEQSQLALTETPILGSLSDAEEEFLPEQADLNRPLLGPMERMNVPVTAPNRASPLTDLEPVREPEIPVSLNQELPPAMPKLNQSGRTLTEDEPLTVSTSPNSAGRIQMRLSPRGYGELGIITPPALIPHVSIHDTVHSGRLNSNRLRAENENAKDDTIEPMDELNIEPLRDFYSSGSYPRRAEKMDLSSTGLLSIMEETVEPEVMAPVVESGAPGDPNPPPPDSGSSTELPSDPPIRRSPVALRRASMMSRIGSRLRGIFVALNCFPIYRIPTHRARLITIEGGEGRRTRIRPFFPENPYSVFPPLPPIPESWKHTKLRGNYALCYEGVKLRRTSEDSGFNEEFEAAKLSRVEIFELTSAHLMERKKYLLNKLDDKVTQEEYNNLNNYDRILFDYHTRHREYDRPYAKLVVEAAEKEMKQYQREGDDLLSAAWLSFCTEYHPVLALDFGFLMDMKTRDDSKRLQFYVLCGLKSVPVLIA